MTMTNLPDDHGRFGDFGGRYVPETLMTALDELERGVRGAKADPAFDGRAAPPCCATSSAGRRRSTSPEPDAAAGRRADLSQARRPGAHRRAQDQQRPRPGPAGERMGKKRIIAETGAGQHGVATATVCAISGSNAWSTWAR